MVRLYRINILSNDNKHMSFSFWLLRENDGKYKWMDLTQNMIEHEGKYFNTMKDSEEHLNKLVENNIIDSWSKLL